MLLLHRQETQYWGYSNYQAYRFQLGTQGLWARLLIPWPQMPQVLQGNVLVDILDLWVSCPLRSCVQHSSTYLVIPLSTGWSPQVHGYRSLRGNTSSSIWVNTSPWCWKVFPLRDHSLLQCLGSRSENWFEPGNMTRDRGLLRHDHLQPPALLFLLLVLYFVHFGKC